MKKLRAKRGFTFTELLTVVLVLALLTTALTAGVNLGVECYEHSVALSESKTLCSSLTSVIADDLSYTRGITIDDAGNLVSYISQYYQSEDREAKFNYMKDDAVDETATKGEVALSGNKVLPSSAYPGGIQASVAVQFIGRNSIQPFFHVVLTTYDAAGKQLADTMFDVPASRALDSSAIKVGT